MSADEGRVCRFDYEGCCEVHSLGYAKDGKALCDEAASDLLAHIDALTARLAEAHAALADLRSRLAGLGTYYRDITAIMALLTQPPTPGGQGIEEGRG